MRRATFGRCPKCGGRKDRDQAECPPCGQQLEIPLGNVCECGRTFEKAFGLGVHQRTCLGLKVAR